MFGNLILAHIALNDATRFLNNLYVNKYALNKHNKYDEQQTVQQL